MSRDWVDSRHEVSFWRCKCQDGPSGIRFLRIGRGRWVNGRMHAKSDPRQLSFPIRTTTHIACAVHGAERHPPGRRGRSLCLDAGAWGVLRAGARGVRDRATPSATPGRETSLVSTALFQGGRKWPIYWLTYGERHHHPQIRPGAHHCPRAPRVLISNGPSQCT